MTRKIQRRHFLMTSAAVAGTQLLPSFGHAAFAVEKLRTAHIGVGGMGGSDLRSVASHPKVEVAALCDVDSKILAGAQRSHKNAATFSDYREMLAKMGDKIDAVVVSTPDHTHAPAAMSAMNLGKPVYCQKPLTHEVFEARQLRAIAEKKKLPTQMGIQVHSSSTYRRAVALIQRGDIGKVSRVYAWSSKNWGYDGPAFTKTEKPPTTLAWDLWQGVTTEREYVPRVYHRGQWRKLIDYGTGTLGDMGVHIFDTPYAALALTAPNTAKTICRKPTGIGHPTKNIVEYEFPGTKYTTDKMIWRWYDGRFAPPKNENLGLPKGMKLPGQGALFVGEAGTMLLPHVREATLYEEGKPREYKRPDLGSVSHYHQWVDACMGQGKTSAPFSYAGPLTEALLLGVVANRFPGKTLNWDAKKLRVTNIQAANRLIKREYRDGFEVKNL